VVGANDAAVFSRWVLHRTGDVLQVRIAEIDDFRNLARLDFLGRRSGRPCRPNQQRRRRETNELAEKATAPRNDFDVPTNVWNDIGHVHGFILSCELRATTSSEWIIRSAAGADKTASRNLKPLCWSCQCGAWR
jgi:hypothetical protein